ncbi:MAG: hypothetical protein JKY34_06100 [Kordiimonadaceae bacterium]|nr:hypothetical protein [Kordiimonadaceae bacterium]
MPLNFLPMSPAPAAVRITSHRRTKSTQAASGKILTRQYGGQYFKMSLTYNLMRKDQAGPLLAFLQEQEGRFGIFFVPVDQLSGQAGEVVGNYANFDEALYHKLHMITATSPTAVNPPYNGTGVIQTDPAYMRCSLTSDTQNVSLDRKGLIKISLNLVERF